jgi:hypothetical protein
MDGWMDGPFLAFGMDETDRRLGRAVLKKQRPSNLLK